MRVARAIVRMAVGVLSLLAAEAWAHGGEEHGGETAGARELLSSVVGVAGEGDRFEVVVTPAGEGAMRVFLADRGSNAPVAEAAIEVETSGSPSWKGAAESTPTPGIYRLPWSPQSGEETDLTLTVTVADHTDLILVRLPARDHAASIEHRETTVPFVPRAGVGAGVLVGGILGWWLGRRKIGTTVMLALLLLATMPREVLAHGGEDHGSPPQESRTAEAGGTHGLLLPKASQFLLEVRTVVVGSREVTESVRLVGRVIPDPAAHARIHPSVVSRIGYDPEFPPPRSGQQVRRGQTIAVLDPILSATEKSGQRQALFKGEGPESMVGREMALAPIDGQLTDVHIVPGEVVSENEVLAEIIDPARLWVEATLYDAPLAERITGGAARTRQIPDRAFPLILAGVSPKVNPENQGLHLQFAIRETDGRLKSGMPVDVYAHTGATTFALAVPRVALLERGGLPLVWVKTAPERFEGRAVRLGRRTAEWVEILEGVRPDERVVVQGQQQLDAMR